MKMKWGRKGALLRGYVKTNGFTIGTFVGVIAGIALGFLLRIRPEAWSAQEVNTLTLCAQLGTISCRGVSHLKWRYSQTSFSVFDRKC